MRSAIADCLQRGQRLLQILTNTLERQDMNARDDCGKPADAVDPYGFAAPDNTVNGKTAEDRRARAVRDGIDAALFDAHVARWLAGNHRQGLGPAVLAPSN